MGASGEFTHEIFEENLYFVRNMWNGEQRNGNLIHL